MLGESTHLAKSKEWVSSLILINLITHLIQTNALPDRPSPGDSGKPHGATTYLGYLEMKSLSIKFGTRFFQMLQKR